MILKANQGVKVRVLIDSVGSFFLYFNQKYLKKLKKAGGTVSFFMPIFKQPFQKDIWDQHIIKIDVRIFFLV